MILANRHGHIVCTQGGESLAGLAAARQAGVITGNEHAICDATAHHLKFIGFQQMYFEDGFPPEFGVKPRKDLVNMPQEVAALPEDQLPAPGKPLEAEAFQHFVEATSGEVAKRLGLEKK